MLLLEQPIEDNDSNVLYDVMRKEVRQAVEEIRTQLEKVPFDRLTFLETFVYLLEFDCYNERGSIQGATAAPPLHLLKNFQIFHISATMLSNDDVTG